MWFRILGSITLIVIAFFWLDMNSLWETAANITPLRFAIAVALTQLSFVLLALRWIRMVQPVAPATNIKHLRMYLYGLFLNTFTPGNLGGDVYRIFALKPMAETTRSIVLVLLQERLIGLLTFVVAYVLCAVWLVPSSATLSSLYFVAAAPLAAVALLLLFLPRFMRWLLAAKWLAPVTRKVPKINVLREVNVFGKTRDGFALSAYSCASIVCWLSAVNVVAADLSLTLPTALIAAIAILTELVRTIPVSLQGIGLREASFASLVGLAGGSPEVGFLVGALSYLALSVCLLLNGLIAVCLGTHSAAVRV